MPDGSQTPLHYKHSEQFGQLILADSFVKRAYEPADETTELYIEMLREDLGIEVKGPKNSQKVNRCLSDFLVAAKHSTSGYISWPSSSAEFAGPPYGVEIMRKVRSALEAECLELVQKSSKMDGIAAVYRVNESLVRDFLKFKCHGLGAPVIVRAAKREIGGKVYRGGALSLSQFRPDVDRLEDEVRTINRCMVAHPLEAWSGQEFAFCYRVFNDASLNIGGRLIGGWQNYSEEERLLSLIDGEAVCEIDFKASYISIVNALVGTGGDLDFDPYAKISFVRKQNDPERAKQMRKLAKLLVSAYISTADKQGASFDDLTKFPKGKKERDKNTNVVRTISLRKKFEIPADTSVRDYMADIHEAFPFLQEVKRYPENVMFIESEIIVKAMLYLVEIGIPSYPVHDCLIVKTIDREAAIEALQRSQKEVIGNTLNMDISFIEGDDIKEEKIFAEVVPNNSSTPKFQHLSKYDWGLDDGDVLEDY